MTSTAFRQRVAQSKDLNALAKELRMVKTLMKTSTDKDQYRESAAVLQGRIAELQGVGKGFTDRYEDHTPREQQIVMLEKTLELLKSGREADTMVLMASFSDDLGDVLAYNGTNSNVAFMLHETLMDHLNGLTTAEILAFHIVAQSDIERRKEEKLKK